MKIDRLVSIIMILLERDRVSAQELSTMFEVSNRTIYRDIETINLAGIPVYAIPGIGGGFEIMEKYKVDKKVFSTSDLSAILMGLSNLSTVIREDEVVNALAKVKSFIPAERAQDIEWKTNQIYIDLSSWVGNRNIQLFLEIIKEALQESKLLSFNYINHKGTTTARVVEPYQLVLKNSDWYYQGYCLKRNDFRLFKICRISNLKIQENSFIPREYQKPVLEFSNSLDNMLIRIKIRIHKSVMDRALDFCEYEYFSIDGKDYYIVDFPFIENDFYYDVLLGFGDKCECLEPVHVRNEIKRRIDNMIRLYGE